MCETAQNEIDAVIADVTGMTGVGAGETVWVYGEVVWMHGGEFTFQPEGGRVVGLTTSLVRRFRDGESSMFLIELPYAMARGLGIDAHKVEGHRLERLRGRCRRY